MVRADWTERHDDTERQGVVHTDMATPAGFSSFVIPRVAIGPGKKAADAETSALDLSALPVHATPTSSRLLTLRHKADRAHEVVVTSWSQAL